MHHSAPQPHAASRPQKSNDIRGALLAALATALALTPSLANAATDAFTIYAYGSGNVLRQIFEGMKGFVDDPGYRLMLFTLLLLTMIYTIVRGYLFSRPSAMPIVGMVLGTFVLNIALFSNSAKVDLHIEDEVHSEDYLISDMPLILAGAAALTSEMSRYMVKLVEGFYMGPAIPLEMRMSEHNTYNFASKIMTALRNVTISDPLTKATFNSYMRECVVPDLYQGRIQLRALLNGPPDQFWPAIRSNNLVRMSICFQYCGDQADGEVCAPAECPSPYVETAAGGTTTAGEWRQGMMVPCPDGHDKLGERISTLIGATAFNQLGNSMLHDSTLLDGVISSTITHLTGVTGATGTEHFVRAGMMNMFRESSASVIANGGTPGLIQVLGTEQAKATQRTNWMVAADVFAESVAYLWAALQAFIFAIFPIAVVLFVFPGLGPKAMAGYFGLLAWISLWMPFLAIINFLSISWLAEDIRTLAMTNLSYGSLLPISEAGSNMQSVTNFLGTMVPVLTYGMVRGGEFALTELARDASAPMSSAAAARDIAAKSYSYGSIAANNLGANKFDSTTAMSMGYEAVSEKSGTGSFKYSRIQPWAGAMRAGQALGASIASTNSSREGQTSARGAAAGQSVSTDSYSDSGTQRAASMAVSAGAMDQTTASAVKEASRGRADNWQQFVSAAADSSQSFQLSSTLEGRVSAQASAGVKGALGLAGIASAMIVGAGDRLDAKTPDRFLSNLKADGGSAQDFVNKFGARASSETEAEELVRQAGGSMSALQAQNPGMSPQSAANAVGLQAMSGLSNKDLGELKSQGAISGASFDAIKGLQASGVGTRQVAGLALAGTSVVAGTAAIASAVSGAVGTGAAVAGGSVAAPVALATLGVLGSMTDARTGGEARFSVGQSTKADEGSSRREGSGLTHGETFTDALGTKEAELRSRGFTSSIDAVFKTAAANSDGRRVQVSDSGAITVTTGSSRNADFGTAITTNLGNVGFAGDLDPAYSAARGDIDETKAKIAADGQGIQGAIDGTRGRVADGAAATAGTPSMPSIKPGAGPQATQAVQQRVGDLSPGDAGKPAAFAQTDGRVAIATQGQTAINERFKGPLGQTVRDTAATSASAVRIGENVVAMPLDDIYNGLKGGQLAGSKIERMLDANRLVNDAVSKTTGGQVQARSFSTDSGATIYELTDRNTGVAVMTGLDRSGNLTLLEDRHNRENAGAFIKGAGGALLPDTSKFGGMPAEEAGDGYWRATEGSRADAMFRVRTGSDAPSPVLRIDPSAVRSAR